jgi:hypothetical protein
MKIRPGKRFQREFKRLHSKYQSLPYDVERLGDSLKKNPFQGVSLGESCYKVRISIESKGQGKSGSARVILNLAYMDDEIVFLSIYDKSEIDTISRAKLEELLREEGLF